MFPGFSMDFLGCHSHFHIAVWKSASILQLCQAGQWIHRGSAMSTPGMGKLTWITPWGVTKVLTGEEKSTNFDCTEYAMNMPWIYQIDQPIFEIFEICHALHNLILLRHLPMCFWTKSHTLVPHWKGNSHLLSSLMSRSICACQGLNALRPEEIKRSLWMAWKELIHPMIYCLLSGNNCRTNNYVPFTKFPYPDCFRFIFQQPIYMSLSKSFLKLEKNSKKKNTWNPYGFPIVLRSPFAISRLFEVVVEFDGTTAGFEGQNVPGGMGRKHGCYSPLINME